MNNDLIVSGVEALTSAELSAVNGGEVTTKTSFAHDVAEWVSTAAVFYWGMAQGFFGG